MNQNTNIPRFRPQINFEAPENYQSIYQKYKDYSMVAGNQKLFLENMLLIDFIGRNVTGDFVECGTWKGGMSCAMMSLGGADRSYHFFDSFEGLPEAKEIDGPTALQYQANTESEYYRDNCNADYDEFMELMRSHEVPDKNIRVYRGWFEDRLPDYPGNPIAVLRLDGDWYDSTMCCMDALYGNVAIGGIIILDDYDAWDGCARATHDFLSKTGVNARILRTPITHIAYLQKME